MRHRAPGRWLQWRRRRRVGAATVATLLVLAGFLGSCGEAADGLDVRTPYGELRGVAVPGADEWLGVSYAPAPVGPLRWQDPGPAPRWDGVRSATAPGPSCPVMVHSRVVGSEDCLHLDVYRPPGSATGLPVAVFVHGGSFVAGDADQYDPVRLVDAGHMIVVVIDYRLGALGFLAADGLDGPGPSGGDFGLADQQAALRWVHQAAGSFGGDPSRVSVFGESAGGISVCDLLASPASDHLVDAAIDESGPCTGILGTGPTLRQAAADGGRFATAVGCGDLRRRVACLRSANLARLLGGPAEIAGGVVPLPWQPAVGGPLLPQPAATVLASGTVVTPLLDGFDSKDGLGFEPISVDSPDNYLSWLQAEFGLAGSLAVATEYPVGATATSAAVRTSASQVITDGAFACPAIAVEEGVAHGRHDRVWGYQFADPAATAAGAVHASELAYLFGAEGSRLPTGSVALASAMARAWAQMLSHGAPPSSWPRSSATGSTVEELAPPTPEAHPDAAAEHHCGFWAGFRADR